MRLGRRRRLFVLFPALCFVKRKFQNPTPQECGDSDAGLFKDPRQLSGYVRRANRSMNTQGSVPVRQRSHEILASVKDFVRHKVAIPTAIFGACWPLDGCTALGSPTCRRRLPKVSAGD